jgi:hypothetical protein
MQIGAEAVNLECVAANLPAPISDLRGARERTCDMSRKVSADRKPRTPGPPNATRTPTSTPIGSQVTPMPTGPQPTLTLQASTTPPASATPQPLTVITAGFSCTNGVCTLGPGNVGTFFNEYVTSGGGQGPTPYTWRLVSGSLLQVCPYRILGCTRCRSRARPNRPGPLYLEYRSRMVPETLRNRRSRLPLIHPLRSSSLQAPAVRTERWAQPTIRTSSLTAVCGRTPGQLSQASVRQV